MKKSKIALIVFILLWVVGFLIFWGTTLFRKEPAKKIEHRELGRAQERAPDSSIQLREVIQVRCYRVSLTDFKDDLPVLGTVKGALKINLKFEINGVVESINFREGDLVYKGDMIASLDKKDAQLKVDYAKSKLESSEIQAKALKKRLEINKNLYEIGGIIKARLEEIELEAQSAEAQVKSVQVELKSAETEFQKTNLFAPRDGVLGSRDVEAGEFVTPNNNVATLYDTSEVFVELGIVEKDIDKIALGQDVVVTVDAYPGETFEGLIDNVFPVVEGKSRTLTVRIRIDNRRALLIPGMFARALITVAKFNNALVVPSMSLNKTEHGYEVFIVGENNTVSSRTAQIDYVTSDYTVMASGVREGELVVIESPQELEDGMPVDVIEVQEGIIE